MSSLMTLPRPPRPPTRREQALAICCHLLSLALIRMPFRHLTGILAGIKRRTPVSADTAAAERAAMLATWASRWSPARAACFEHTVTTLLITATQRRSVTLCIGVRGLPYAAHAWIETDDQQLIGVTDPEQRPYVAALRI